MGVLSCKKMAAKAMNAKTKIADRPYFTGIPSSRSKLLDHPLMG
jgi:hypothetical protein